MHAVILAGGRGVQIRPYTTSLPKPLVPIGDRYTILEIVLTQLADQGFERVTLAIGHLGHLIRAFVGDGNRWGLDVEYVEEPRPLGTIGPVLRVLDRLPSQVLVMNGDVLTDLDFADVLRRHRTADHPLTVATCGREVEIDFGVLEEQAGRVLEFLEKPVRRYRVSAGVYAVTTAMLRDYRAGAPLGFDQLMIDLIRRGTPPATYAHDGYWLDIGRGDDYDRANEEFAGRARRLLPAGARHAAGECPGGTLVRPVPARPVPMRIRSA